jgi:cell division protein FtsL
MLEYRGNTEPIDLGALDAYEDDEAARARSAKRHRERIAENKDPNDNVSKRGNWFGLTLCGVGVVAAFFFFLHGDIVLHEINQDITAVEARISEVSRDNSRLTTELESIATPSRVEEFAEENGLVKEQVLHVTHVEVNIESVIEVAEEEELTFLERLGALLDSWVEFLAFD